MKGSTMKGDSVKGGSMTDGSVRGAMKGEGCHEEGCCEETPSWSTSGRYASYWKAFLFSITLLCRQNHPSRQITFPLVPVNFPVSNF